MTQQENAGILGMSLIDKQLRIVEGRKLASEIQISKLAQGRIRHQFGFDVFDDKGMPRKIAEDIIRLIETQDFEVKDVAFSLDSRMVLVKKLEVDKELEGDKLKDHINWEVSQFAISPIDEYVIDYEVLKPGSNGTLNNVLVVVVRKRIVHFLKQIFKHTDLKLKVIDVDVFSAQRALQVNYDYNSDDKVGLIAIEDKRIHFSILEGRNLFLTQDVSLFQDSTNADTKDETSTTRIISKELRRIILDHQLGKSIEDLNEIILYGESVEDQLLEELQNNHDVHIDRANPFKKIKLVNETKEEINNSRSERFMISVGAAIRGIQ